MKKPVNYVDPKRFLADMLEFEERKNKSLNPDLEHPSVYVQESVLKIAKKLLNSPSIMAQYVDRNELLSEAVYKCTLAFKKFDSSESINAFAYFTSVCWWAYLGIFKKEQTEFKNKCRMIQQNSAARIMEVVSELDGTGVSSMEGVEDVISDLQVYLDYDLVKAEEDKKKKAAKKITRPPLYLQKKRKEREDALKNKEKDLFKKDRKECTSSVFNDIIKNE